MTDQEKLFTIANIPAEELQIMAKEYRRHARKHPDYVKGDHVKSVWFPIGQIVKMCGQLMTEGADGVRIYFGRYPENLANFKGENLVPNSNTVILVSTQKEGKLHKDYFKAISVNAKAIDIEPENRGEQCQPHCDGTGVDDGENEEDPII
jgi:hypothetical protein